MKKVGIVALLFSAVGLQAQVFGFEETTFGTANVLNGKEGSTQFNFSSSGNSVVLPVKWDTSWGGYWASGWALSQKYDSTRETSNFTKHLYSSIAYKGAEESNTFAVGTSGSYINLNSTDTNVNIFSLMISNSTFAYNSMKFGDMIAKKFGGTMGSDADSLILIIEAYTKHNQNWVQTVRFPLADYRFTNASQDYLLEGWNKVDVSGDSLVFSMESSDNGMFGINTPLYFCIDNISAGIKASVLHKQIAVQNIYPNPASNDLTISSLDKIQTAKIYSLQGKLCAQYNVQKLNARLNIQNLPQGVYILQLQNSHASYTTQFIKN